MKLYNIYIKAICVIFLTCNLAFADNTYKIIKIVDSDTFYADFNNDGIPQPDEKVRIPGVDGFETKHNRQLQNQVKLFGLRECEVLGLGYLGTEFAKKELLNKYVRLESTDRTEKDKYNRYLMSVYYDGKNYETELLKAGLGYVYPYSKLSKQLKQYENKDKIRSNVAKIR